MNDHLIQAKELINKSQQITVLTGAGISTESGISDFRSPGGVWSRYKAVTLQEFTSSLEKRKYYWQYKAETIPAMLKAKSNSAHKSLVQLDTRGKLLCLLTQNIDGLHEKSGISRKKIVRLHGTNSEAVCLSCADIIPIQKVMIRIEQGETDPHCEVCGGLLKPNTISFGQRLREQDLIRASRATEQCDLFMALGSSLQVYPACGFVELATQLNKPLIIINRDPTPFDHLAAFCFSATLGQILPVLCA
ncbi:MAG: Sir2 family NAD-dependent protein deacetylase [Spirochaetales bacterium]|nr:Sir2 family NAD-dependent protein deacetylase [Spirochaetales bacterium]